MAESSLASVRYLADVQGSWILESRPRLRRDRDWPQGNSVSGYYFSGHIFDFYLVLLPNVSHQYLGTPRYMATSAPGHTIILGAVYRTGLDLLPPESNPSQVGERACWSKLDCRG